VSEPDLDPGLYRELVRRALAEDLGWGDTTTLVVVPPEVCATGTLTARADVVLAGLDVAVEAFRQLDPAVVVAARRHDGDLCRSAEPIAEITGLAAPMLTAERTALNFLRHLSGVASVTRWLVQAGGGGLRIADTRKTLPLLRALQKYAVRVGGGSNSRLALDEGLVIKANHVRVAGGLRLAVQRARAARPDTPIEVETATIADVDEALAAGAAVLLFTGASIDDLRHTVRLCAGRARVVVSGPIPVDSVASLALAGADVVSMGSITESAPAADISFELRPL
jgi:nicotinate-nucleotide pyrophosphorylase (carboxylating)